MNEKEATEAITSAVKKALKIKLEPGEVCPCCGRVMSKRRVSEKMLAANRENLKKANEARLKK